MSQPVVESETAAPLRLLMGFQRLSEATRDRTQVIRRGRGVFVYDDEGRDYLEAAASFYVASLGYSDEELIEAAAAQLRELPYYFSGMFRATPTALALAEKLAELVPLRDARIAFGCSGSEANDFLLKFVRFRSHARGEPRRTKVIARRGSYSGATLASASLTGGHHEEFGLPLDGILHTHQPDYVNTARPNETEEDFAARMVDELEALIVKEGPETIAAFLTEPVSFSCGLVMPPAGYFERLQAMLRGYGILYLDDEVVTGFCRTGSLFGCQSFGIEPDCMTFAKSITSGYFPLSAIAMSGDFYADLEKGCDEVGWFAHAATYAGHPVGAAVALKVLEIIERRNLPAHVRDDVGPHLQAKVAGYAGHPLVHDVRGVGLAAAVEFRHDDDAARPLEPSSEACRVFCERAAANGLFVRGTGASVVVAPPLVITREEIDELFRRFDAALRETERALGV